MTYSLFIELVAKVGLPAAEFLYARYVKKDDILTSDDLETLRTLAAYTSHEALAQAGIKIINGQVVQL